MTASLTPHESSVSPRDDNVAIRREKIRLEGYVDDRAKRTLVRFGLYVIGCGLGYMAIGLWLSLAALAMLVISDLIDVFVLVRWVRPLARAGQVRRAQQLTVVGGVTQGIGFALALGFYFFTVPQPDILFVIGGLGLGAVNSAIVLPSNRVVGLTRLALYAVTPVAMVLIQKYALGGWEPVVIGRPPILMLLGCMFYMFIAFTKTGIATHNANLALFHSREDLKLANAHMARQQAEMRKLSQVAEKANDTVIITDKDRNIVWVNEAFTRNSGFSKEEAVGQNVAQLMTGGDPEILKQDDIDNAVNRREGFRGELQSVRKDGTHYWSDANLFPIFDGAGKIEFFVTIERDVTEARKWAAEMAKARAQAEAGAKAKSDFLANMSHEIRTPLSGVVGTADLLAETALDAEQRRFADTIRGSSMSLLAIINDILDLSKLDAGRMELDSVVFSPKVCLRETLDLLEPMARSKGLALEFEVEDGVLPAVKTDDGRLRQVATNIIGNAIKFTQSGSVTVHLHNCDAQRLRFSVSDTGIGISKEKLNQIFDHFTQAEASTTRRFGGSGLGLSISRHIVDLMGGDISVTSQVGQGSSFVVDVPVDVPDANDAEVIDPVKAFGAITLDAGLSLLIVEDNQTNRFLLSRYLKDQPISVDYAVDGVEALEKVAQGAYDLIFMDVSMPRMGGIEATREIRQMPILQPSIIALTAHAFDEERQCCLDAGMDDFLTKPIRKADFLRRIATFQAETLKRKGAA